VSVFEALVGQQDALVMLQAAARRSSTGAANAAMTHAWLFTGPAGSGRSVAALAFAAALQCEQGGCGACHACHTTLAGSHADVRRVIPEGLTIGVDDMRALVLRAASSPTVGRWQILLIEDADRLTEAAANALLKAVEEPAARTIFLLCAPSIHPEDVSVTLRSRCRLVMLRSPSSDAVASVLVRRDGVSPRTAQWAAAAAQGHVGRARRLAVDAAAQQHRAAVLGLPRSLSGVGACFAAADELIKQTDAQASALIGESDEYESEQLTRALGAGGSGKGSQAAARGASAAQKELARKQKSRATRTRRDCLDRALVDLAAFYRDVLMVCVGAGSELVHPDVAEVSQAAAARWSAESIVRRIDAVLACRDAIAENVKPRIAVEAMMLTLHEG